MSTTAPVTFSSFFRYYIFNFDKAPTKKDQAIAAIVSVALGILTLGLLHIICFGALYNRNIAPITKMKTPEQKASRLFQESFDEDSKGKKEEVDDVTALQDHKALVPSRDQAPTVEELKRDTPRSQQAAIVKPKTQSEPGEKPTIAKKPKGKLRDRFKQRSKATNAEKDPKPHGKSATRLKSFFQRKKK